jgi:ubiquinone/menaquinone biosynthesis C-methylase UbiE
MNKINLLETFEFVDGVYFQRGIGKKDAFEKKYLSIREKENRIYSDEQVGHLPEVNPNHPHYQEWRVRNESMQRLVHYVNQKKCQQILDIGCGNGWLSNCLAKTKSEVFALDVNEVELRQASKVFREADNLRFIYADILSNPFKKEKLFDLIVLSSSIQYFPDLTSLIQCLQPLLLKGGEIHILDSPIYPNKTEALSAKKRSEEYFKSMQHGWMNHYYFHHTFDQFRSFDFNVLYDPSSLYNRFRKIFSAISPFPWILIKSSNS